MTSYRDRFWKQENFAAIEVVRAAIAESEFEGEKPTPTLAALRWIVHHSRLDGAKGGILIHSPLPILFKDSLFYYYSLLVFICNNISSPVLPCHSLIADAVILGASKIGHLEENIHACKAGPLPKPVRGFILSLR